MIKKEVREYILRIALLLITLVAGLIIKIESVNALDRQISVVFEGIRNILLDYLLISVSIVSNSFIIFFFIATIFLFKKSRKRWILPLTLSFLVSWSYSFIIKQIVHRNRPFQDGVVQIFKISFMYLKNSFGSWNSSFPSMHAVMVFAGLPVIYKEYKKFSAVWLVFALLVAISRIYFGAHYFTDVITGAIIGLLIGQIFVYLEEKHNWGQRLISKFEKKN